MSLSMSRIESIIEEHVKSQPYDITCEQCGEILDHETKMDSDFDLTITVTKCDCEEG